MEIATAFVTIRPETAGFEAELAAAVGGQSVDVPVTADVGDAEAAVEGLSGSDVEVGVEADTSDAEGAIEGIEAPPIEAEVQVDTSGAEEQIGGLGDSLSGLVGGGGEATGALDAFSGAALGAGSAGSIAATGGLAAVAAGLGYAVSEGAEAQVTLGQLEAMVANLGNNAGVTSGGLQALATDLQQTAGFSDEAVMSGESMVLMFENVRNTADQPIFDRAIRSAADLARSPFGNGDISASARTLGRALEDPTASFGRLARQGITFSAAQEQAITSMQAAGDVAGAQAVLLDAVDAKVGGLAQQYGGTFTGSVDRAKEAVGEMAESLGTSLLPALELVSESVIDQIARLQSWDDALNGALLSGPLQAIMGVGDAIDAQGAVVGDLPPALRDTSAAADEAAANLDDFGQSIDEYLTGLFSLPEAQREARQAISELAEAVSTGTWDDQAVAMENVVTETAKVITVQQNLGASQQELDTTIYAQIAALAQARDQGRITGDQFDTLSGQIRGVPHQSITPVSAPGATQATGEVKGLGDAVRKLPPMTFAGVQARGAAQAITDIDRVKQRLDALPKNTDVWVNIHTSGSAKASARGGPLEAGELSLVGEEGPELFVPNTGGNIIPAMETASLMMGQGATYNTNVNALAAVNAASGPMGAAGTAAGASGAAGIDAGLAFSNASGIGQIVGVQYGAGVASGISGMYATVNAVATNVIAGAGNISSAYSRGQALGSAYGSGIVAGLAGQIGNAGATAASLRRAAQVESASVGAGLTRPTVGGATSTIVHQTVLDGRVLTQTVNDINYVGSIAEGYEQ